MFQISSRISRFILINKQSISLFAGVEKYSKCFSRTSYNLVSTFDSSIFDILNGTKSTKTFTKEWKKLLNKAEKSVGYPTSFLNLRYLVSDEIANVASLLRKLMKTNHPLIATAKKLINEPDKYTQLNGLIILLVSKSVGIPKNVFLSTDISSGIHQSQRHLAEICEMINMASIIHRGVVDIELMPNEVRKNMDYGNKIAILCGDYLLANACTHLSKLKNTQVVDLMSQVIADISQSLFIRHDLNKKSNSYLKDWYKDLYGSSSSLLANSCKCSVLLVNQPVEIQTAVWDFANNFDITHKIWIELNEFKKNKDIEKPNSIINAIYRDNKASNNSITTNQDTIYKEALGLFNKHFQDAFKDLEILKVENSENDAINSLISILNLMKTNLD